MSGQKTSTVCPACWVLSPNGERGREALATRDARQRAKLAKELEDWAASAQAYGHDNYADGLPVTADFLWDHTPDQETKS